MHTLSRPNDKVKIVKHYNIVSPYYLELWGEHIHHGYWITGDESKDTAQVQLIEHLAELAEIKYSADVLDIGCGMGRLQSVPGKAFSLLCHRNHDLACPTGNGKESGG